MHETNQSRQKFRMFTDKIKSMAYELLNGTEGKLMFVLLFYIAITKTLR
mgnify:CR=1 FL=1